MKKIIYTLFALAVTLTSCSEDHIQQNKFGEDYIVLNVFNSPMTKATASGEEYERQLNRLDCFFYVKGQTSGNCVYYQKVDLSEVGQAEIPFYVDESVINTIFPSGTTCDVFVIANLPEGTFAANAQGTDVQTLSKTLLELGNGYDAIDKPFIMAGLGEATKGNNNNATGTIPLYRAASKITVTLQIPATITDNGITMTPVLTEDTGAVTLKTAFHNGATKTYLYTDYVDDYGNSLIAESDLFSTDKVGYTFVSTTEASGDVPAKHVYACEIPFYSYARAWEKGASDAAYLTLELPWKNETDQTYKPYYYQILVNGAGRSFEPNHWYDLTVNVGVLGSTVESKPTLIEDLTYYILDWTTEPESETGDRYENVNIQNYTYLIVPEHVRELNNKISGVIRYDSSHSVEILNVNATYQTFTSASPTTNTLPEDNYTIEKQTIDGVTYIYFYHNFSDEELYDDSGTNKKIYSPITITATIRQIENTEFSEDITFIQYPPIYIQSHTNSEYSTGKTTVAVNGYFTGAPQTTSGTSLGGLKNKGQSETPNLYTISISSFDESYKLEYDGGEYDYIIGDPRVQEVDNIINETEWDEAEALYGDSPRRLQYYYPADGSDDAFRVIAPKFRIVSAYSSSGGNSVNSHTAKLRCASYQEDGYPAGRWRLPTFAEVQFAVYIQSVGIIPKIFKDITDYYFATGDLVNTGDFDITTGSTTNNAGSVRCVYDEWYWGSDPIDDPYTFTWGDEPR